VRLAIFGQADIIRSMDTNELAGLFKALSEPVRVRLIALLLQREELCVCDLIDAMALSQSVISRHLAYLRNHELVIASRRGVWMYYQINPHTRQTLAPLWSLISANAALSQELAEDLQRLSSEGACCN
jgi:ArsR family transcriptional regulator, arsenate/arsenite/antimonite-responsive transcriptional repressor